jgi:hypothetical protein
MLLIGTAAFPYDGLAKGGTVFVRIRADESVRAVIPPIVQGNLNQTTPKKLQTFPVGLLASVHFPSYSSLWAHWQ